MRGFTVRNPTCSQEMAQLERQTPAAGRRITTAHFRASQTVEAIGLQLNRTAEVHFHRTERGHNHNRAGCALVTQVLDKHARVDPRRPRCRQPAGRSYFVRRRRQFTRECLDMLTAFMSLSRDLLSTRWSLLLIFTMTALFAQLKSGMSTGQLIAWFVICGLGLIPLARMISEMVDALADRLGDRIGGLVSVGLGNLVELVVSFSALAGGLYPLVVSSIAGAVITNCLLILGISTCLAARKKEHIDIHPHSSGLQSQQLLLSTIVLIIPTIFYSHKGHIMTDGGSQFDGFAMYSVIVSLLILGFYLLSFVYQMGSARSLYGREDAKDGPVGDSEQQPLAALIALLLIISLVLVGVSENLVESLQLLVDEAHLNPLFVGLFLLPLFGSFSEGLVAIKAATSQRMDLAMTSTVESSVQLLLFVLPVLVICGVPMSRFLHLVFPSAALFSMGATVLAVYWITENRKLSWYEGALLLTLYAVMALGSLLLG